MISSIAWVPKGVADPSPKKYELSSAEQELVRMMEAQGLTEGDGDETEQNAEEEIEEEEEDEEEEKVSPAKKNKKKEETPHHGLPADLRMDEYSSDEDENDEAVQGVALGSLLMEKEEEASEEDPEKDTGNNDEKMGSDSSDDDDDDDDLDDIPDTREYEPINVEGLESMGFSQVGSNAPMYMDGDEEFDDDDSEADDVRLNENDAIIVVAKTEEDFASLEVHVYEQHTGNLFVHHDVPLPAFPLCLAHGDIGPSGSAGNFCAVGMFSPGIEIWNLDVLNALEPSCILGGVDTSMADELMAHKLGLGSGSSKKKKKKKSQRQGPELRKGSHTDAVMALSWNKIHRQVIASGSADCTVKIWDVTHSNSDKANERTYSHHQDKVQSVVWHTTEGSLLATGSYDRTVALVDARSSGDDIKRVKIPADCETIAWDPFNPQNLTVASEDGTVMCWDVRKFSDSTPLWSFVANEYGGVSDMSYNSHVPGMLATCAVDKTVTLWDTHQENANMPPRACGNKDMKVGKLYSVNFYPSTPWLLGCGGSGKELALWDMSEDVAVQKRFGSRCTGNGVASAQQPEDSVPEEPIETTVASAAHKANEKTTSSKKKKDGKNKKKKVHRAGR